jgi:serine/threonine protein kinase
LIESDGYPIIVDFGFAKYVVDKTFTLCGTPLFIAPEVILNRGHNYGADHWSLGCLIYVLLAGVNPFYVEGMDQSALFKAIVKGEFRMPKFVSHDAINIISGLLQRHPSRRLGTIGKGIDDLLDHDWFRSVDHDRLLLKELPAPYIPTIENPFDALNFEDWSMTDDKTKKNYPPIPASKAKLFEAF